MPQQPPTAEPARICQQARQAFEGDAWHGPSVWEIVADIDVDQASARPRADVHSIWEIVLHLVATQCVLMRRLDGDETAIDLPETEEWPAVVDASEAAWKDTLKQLAAGDRALRDRIAAFPQDRLDDPLIPGGSSAYNNFHGYIQHNLYHAAQVKLLKKMQMA